MSSPAAQRHGVTIKHVAARAGVSWKTVTNVVHNRPNVRAETRQRVIDAIDELDYRPVLAARQLRQGHSQTLTLVVPDILNPYFAMLIKATFEAASARGYAVFVESAGLEPRDERQAAASLFRFAFDGVIFHPTHVTPTELADIATRQPVVLVGENLEHAPLDRVSIDNVEAADQMTSHLLAAGRRTVAFLGTRDGPSQPSGVRLRGYQNALQRAGIEVRDDLQVDAQDFDHVHGVRGATQLLAKAPDIDAIVCVNDVLAIGALKYLRDTGRRVPDDVAVTGWDNVPDSAYTAPPLTTVDAHVEQIATHTVDLLVKRIADPNRPFQDIVVEHHLVVRNSST